MDLIAGKGDFMQRCWFKVWGQGQAIDPPTPEDDLPRRARIVGNLATCHGRGRVLSAVYVLAADATQAGQLFEKARALLLPA